MMRSLYYLPNSKVYTELPVKAFADALQNPDGLLWVDFESTPPENDEPIMREVFGFHPLAVDDALQESHVPKLDDWGEYLYIVLHAVILDRQDGCDVQTLELDIFLGKNYMVTHHDQHISAVDRVWTACKRDERHLKRGADVLFYRLADEVVASYMPAVEEMDNEIDHIEDQVFDNPTSETLEQIFTMKRAALQLRRIIGPQREVLNKLARDDYKVVNPSVKVYFRDVYDHLVRLHDISEGLRDLISGTLDTYLSVVNNRMNDIMKALTVITTLFLPISFLSSFFGMNFFQPPDTLKYFTGKPAFVVMMGITVLAPIAMFLWMRRRGWM